MVRMPRRRAVRTTRRAISPRLATRREPIIVSHPEYAEARRFGNGRVQAGRDRQAQYVAGLDRVDDPVVPQPGAGMVGIALFLVALANRRLECRLLRCAPALAL